MTVPGFWMTAHGLHCFLSHAEHILPMSIGRMTAPTHDHSLLSMYSFLISTGLIQLAGGVRGSDVHLRHYDVR